MSECVNERRAFVAGLQDTPEVDEAGYAELERAELNRIMEKFLHEEQVAWCDLKVTRLRCDKETDEANRTWTDKYTAYRLALERFLTLERFGSL